MTTPFDSFDAFQAAVVSVPPVDGERLRARLIAARLDTQYQVQAADSLALRQFGDGLAYTGYLWDFLADKEIVGEDEIWQRVDVEPAVFAMWDIHSTERVRIPDYFNFPKYTVLSAAPTALRQGLTYLPEDLYMFDNTCEWVGVLTHESVDGQRYCVWSGQRPIAVERGVPAAAHM